MSEQKWACTVCKATARVDVDVQPITYHTYYPADTGPMPGRRMPHSCPVKLGLLPDKLEEHPNARKVS